MPRTIFVPFASCRSTAASSFQSAVNSRTRAATFAHSGSMRNEPASPMARAASARESAARTMTFEGTQPQ